MKKHFFAVAMLIIMLIATSCAAEENASFTSEEGCQHTSWSKATCVELSTCQNCGKTRGGYVPHNFPATGGTCQSRKTCRICGAEGDFGDHQYIGGNCVNPSVCKFCGAEGCLGGHEYVDGDCVNPSVCKFCGSEGSLGDHEYDAKPTCTEGCVCAVCGDTIDPLGHDMKEATCTEASTCRRCGYTENDSLGHDGYGVCNRCGEQIPIVGSGHGDGVVSDITLGDSGIYVLHMTHNERRNFIVHSFDATGDEEYLINEIVKYDGTVLFVGTSPMMINVEADGDWTFEVTALGTTSDTSFSGSGDFVTKCFSCASGTNVWHFKHDGSHNFIVWVYTTDGSDLIVNEIGAYDADQIVKIPSGAAFFEVTADGNWEIYID